MFLSWQLAAEFLIFSSMQNGLDSEYGERDGICSSMKWKRELRGVNKGVQKDEDKFSPDFVIEKFENGLLCDKLMVAVFLLRVKFIISHLAASSKLMCCLS